MQQWWHIKIDSVKWTHLGYGLHYGYSSCDISIWRNLFAKHLGTSNKPFVAHCACLSLWTITHTIFQLFSKTKANTIELSTFFKSDKIENMYLSLLKNTWKHGKWSRQLPIPQRPQQNGEAKRKNKTLIRSSRAMIMTTSLQGSYMGELVIISCCLQNCSLRASITYQSEWKLVDIHEAKFKSLK